MVLQPSLHACIAQFRASMVSCYSYITSLHITLSSPIQVIIRRGRALLQDEWRVKIFLLDLTQIEVGSVRK